MNSNLKYWVKNKFVPLYVRDYFFYCFQIRLRKSFCGGIYLQLPVFAKLCLFCGSFSNNTRTQENSTIGCDTLLS